jgi:hypothetical protein
VVVEEEDRCKLLLREDRRELPLLRLMSVQHFDKPTMCLLLKHSNRETMKVKSSTMWAIMRPAGLITITTTTIIIMPITQTMLMEDSECNFHLCQVPEDPTVLFHLKLFKRRSIP